MMENNKTCGNCIFLATHEGEPFYCIRQDLYTIRESEDDACNEWQWKDALKRAIMTDKITFTVPGEPVAQARPRVTRRGAYDPPKCKTYKELVALYARQAMREAKLGGKPLMGAIDCYIAFKHDIPKSFSVKKARDARIGIYPKVTKPDIDNLAKGVMDALKGIVWKDDSQVTRLTVDKKYSGNPCVEVRVYTE